MKKSNKAIEDSDNDSIEDSDKDSNTEIDEIEEETIEDSKPVKKTGKGNHILSPERIHQLSLARIRAADLRKQINEAKTVPIKVKKPSKLEIQLAKLKMDQQQKRNRY